MGRANIEVDKLRKTEGWKVLRQRLNTKQWNFSIAFYYNAIFKDHDYFLLLLFFWLQRAITIRAIKYTASLHDQMFITVISLKVFTLVIYFFFFLQVKTLVQWSSTYNCKKWPSENKFETNKHKKGEKFSIGDKYYKKNLFRENKSLKDTCILRLQ